MESRHCSACLKALLKVFNKKDHFSQLSGKKEESGGNATVEEYIIVMIHR